MSRSRKTYRVTVKSADGQSFTTAERVSQVAAYNEVYAPVNVQHGASAEVWEDAGDGCGYRLFERIEY